MNMKSIGSTPYCMLRRRSPERKALDVEASSFQPNVEKLESKLNRRSLLGQVEVAELLGKFGHHTSECNVRALTNWKNICERLWSGDGSTGAG